MDLTGRSREKMMSPSGRQWGGTTDRVNRQRSADRTATGQEQRTTYPAGGGVCGNDSIFSWRWCSTLGSFGERGLNQGHLQLGMVEMKAATAAVRLRKIFDELIETWSQDWYLWTDMAWGMWSSMLTHGICSRRIKVCKTYVAGRSK